ncbi:MAG: squalene synthase HpnC [Zoogloeaceae bacterium]|jgi:phytoene synthase|nr:squalene synthase HpnC [Zoogloeaceae bacterium]
MPVDHYENFPVASLLLPRKLRAPIAAIYHFARTADDIADEGDATPETRLARLADFRTHLDAIAAGETPAHPVFRQLAPCVRRHNLPLACFHDLLEAFSQDVTQTRHANYAALLEYSRRSANPVGRLILHLAGQATPNALRQSDAICSALQLINFWQDVALDWRKGRIYLPLEDLLRFGVRETDIAAFQSGALSPSPAWKNLMTFQCERTRALMLQGAPLARALPGRLGWEIRLTVQGGLRILEKIAATGYDVFNHRPVLVPRDWLRMLTRSLIQYPPSMPPPLSR